jgi:PRTRC genetic system protein E
MNFFQQLSFLGQGVDIALRIKGKNGKLSIIVEPQLGNVSRLKPLVLTGTPEELDEGFFGQFDGAITAARGLDSNLAEVQKDAAELAEQAKKKGEKPAGKNAPAKPAASGKKSKDQPAKPAKKQKPTPTTGDMFTQVSPDGGSAAEDSSEPVDNANPDEETVETGEGTTVREENADQEENESE